MFKHRTWLTIAFSLQLFTAIVHSLSFFSTPLAANDTEKELRHLLSDYHFEAGFGFRPSYANLFTAMSLCFTLICLFGAAVNYILLKKETSPDLNRLLQTTNTIVMGAVCLAMLFFTFLPPVVCTALIFISTLGARITFRTNA